MKKIMLLGLALMTLQSYAAVCEVKYCTIDGKLETDYYFIKHCRTPNYYWRVKSDTVEAENSVLARNIFIQSYKKSINPKLTNEELNIAILSVDCKYDAAKKPM